MYLGWLIFDGCILTIINKNNDKEPDFLHNIFLNFFPKISESLVNNITNFYFVLSIYIGFYRLCI